MLGRKDYFSFEQNKEKMVELIKDNFKDDISFLFDYISKNNTQYGETIRPKKTENYFRHCLIAYVQQPINQILTAL